MERKIDSDYRGFSLTHECSSSRQEFYLSIRDKGVYVELSETFGVGDGSGYYRHEELTFDITHDEMNRLRDYLNTAYLESDEMSGLINIDEDDD